MLSESGTLWVPARIRHSKSLAFENLTMLTPRSFLPSVAVIAVLAITARPGLAHHGWSGYDDTKVLTLIGTIETSSYVSPHGSVTLKTPEKTWMVVLAPPSRMQSRGLAREMLAAGVEAKVEGYPHRTDDSELRAERITIDGKTIELR
jgi:hypothetical protein